MEYSIKRKITDVEMVPLDIGNEWVDITSDNLEEAVQVYADVLVDQHPDVMHGITVTVSGHGDYQVRFLVTVKKI